jgi:hypothetical protein
VLDVIFLGEVFFSLGRRIGQELKSFVGQKNWAGTEIFFVGDNLLGRMKHGCGSAGLWQLQMQSITP